MNGFEVSETLAVLDCDILQHKETGKIRVKLTAVSTMGRRTEFLSASDFASTEEALEFAKKEAAKISAWMSVSKETSTIQ